MSVEAEATIKKSPPARAEARRSQLPGAIDKQTAIWYVGGIAVWEAMEELELLPSPIIHTRKLIRYRKASLDMKLLELEKTGGI